MDAFVAESYYDKWKKCVMWKSQFFKLPIGATDIILFDLDKNDIMRYLF